MKNWIPAIISSLGLLSAVCLLVWVIVLVSRPDTRTIQQIKEDQYKWCIKNAMVDYVGRCKVYLE